MERPDRLIEILGEASETNTIELFTDSVKEILGWINHLEAKNVESEKSKKDAFYWAYTKGENDGLHARMIGSIDSLWFSYLASRPSHPGDFADNNGGIG